MASVIEQKPIPRRSNSDITSIRHHIDQVSKAAAKPVEPPAHEHIAKLEDRQGLFQLGTVCPAARQAVVRKDPAAAGTQECVLLQGKILVIRRYPAVADPHCLSAGLFGAIKNERF